MFRKRLRGWLPRPDAALDHPWVRRLGPAIQNPRLWHIGRHSIATGAAIGLFFGILLPIGQIPSAALCSVLVRANLAMAIAGTFITNPVTYVPVYVSAYLLGCLLTGRDPVQLPLSGAESAAFWTNLGSLGSTSHLAVSIPFPLLLGTAIVASLAAALGYFGIRGLWRFLVLRARRRRSLVRRAREAPVGAR